MAARQLGGSELGRDDNYWNYYLRCISATQIRQLSFTFRCALGADITTAKRDACSIVEPVPNVASYLARLDTFRTCEH